MRALSNGMFIVFMFRLFPRVPCLSIYNVICVAVSGTARGDVDAAKVKVQVRH